MNDNDLKRFINVYASILFESKQNDVISIKNMISYPLNEDDLKELFDTLILVNPEKDKIKILYDPNDILNESKNYSDILVAILNSKSGTIFNESKIIQLVDKKWKYFKKISKVVKPFYVFKFDFLNKDEIKKILKTYIAADNDILDYYSKKFIDDSGNSSGVYLHSDSFKAICLNSGKNINIALIIHEFTHYLQDIIKNYEHVKFENDFVFDERKIKFLKLNDNELNIIYDCFAEDEIMPYINEFISYLIEIVKEYKNELSISNKIFIDFIQKTLISSKIYDSSFFKMYCNKTDDMIPLYMFICCMVFNIRKNKILKKIEEEIKNI